MAVTALAAVTSCSKEGAPTGVAGPIDVRLVVSDGNGTRVGSDDTDNYIHQLRVYAFIGDEKVGYAEADNLSDRNYIPMTLSKIGRINFYVIANDKFGPNPQKKEDGTWESLTKSDWESLTKTDLESLRFDLSGFSGWQEKDGKFVSPMSNNQCDEFGAKFTGKNENNYTIAYTINPQDIPESGSLVIPVTVQHVLGRLRLMLNKEESDDVTITLTRAEVYHRPDAFRLYFGKQESVDDVISFNYNQTANDDNKELVESLIGTDQPLVTKPADGYTTVARTYLAPNQHGTYDKTGGTFTTSEGTITETGKDKAYRLELTVEFDYGNNHTETKDYTVYLPRVPRNTSIDVQGTFKGSTTINPAFNIMVNAWDEKNIDIPEFL